MCDFCHVSQKNVFPIFVSHAKQKWERLDFMGVFRSKFHEFAGIFRGISWGKPPFFPKYARNIGPDPVFVQRNGVNKNGIDAKL